MDCEEKLVRQAEMTKAVDNSTRVFVYRNMVKALPVSHGLQSHSDAA
jgi:hypothetical protein